MSYLLDKKLKNNKIKKIALIVILFFFLFIFRVNVLSVLSSATHFIFRPFVILGNNIENKFSNINSYFYSKKLLNLENETLKLERNINEAKMSNYKNILDENLKLKEILGRKAENKDMIIASIISKPDRSLYDTLIIDIGTNSGITANQKVFALGNIPIGKIVEVYGNSSKVILYSSPGERADVIVGGKDVVMQIIGRGGGNFEMLLPRDFNIEKSTEVALPGIAAHTVAIVESIISDPRDSYQKALLRSPVNIFELKSVEVEE
jgi:cell shape-determining protein MreC